MDLWRNLRIFIKYSYNNKLKHNTMGVNVIKSGVKPKMVPASNMKKGGTMKKGGGMKGKKC